MNVYRSTSVYTYTHTHTHTHTLRVPPQARTRTQAPHIVRLVDIGLGVHQQPDDALVAAAGGAVEGGHPALPAAQGASAVRGGSARACGGVRGGACGCGCG